MPNIYECLVKLSLKLGQHKIMNVITYLSSIVCQYMSVKRNRGKRVDCNSLHYRSTVHILCGLQSGFVCLLGQSKIFSLIVYTELP